MKRAQITIKGKTYPCYPTAGAMLRFRRMLGKEVTELDPQDIENTGGYLYCCAKSASRREGVSFPFEDEEDFLDNTLPEDITSWADQISEDRVDDNPASSPSKKK